jgi:hypothetical protein
MAPNMLPEKIALINDSVLASGRKRIQARCKRCSKNNSKVY